MTPEEQRKREMIRALLASDVQASMMYRDQMGRELSKPQFQAPARANQHEDAMKFADAAIASAGTFTPTLFDAGGNVLSWDEAAALSQGAAEDYETSKPQFMNAPGQMVYPTIVDETGAPRPEWWGSDLSPTTSPRPEPAPSDLRRRQPFGPLEALSAQYRSAGESYDPAGYKRAGMSAPPGPPKNMGSGGAEPTSMSDMTDQQWADMFKMGFGLTKEQKRADMSGLTPDARQQYLRQSFVAPGQFPDHGANGGPGGGIEMLRQLYMRQSRPIWLQEAINNGDFDPELLDRLARGG